VTCWYNHTNYRTIGKFGNHGNHKATAKVVIKIVMHVHKLYVKFLLFLSHFKANWDLSTNFSDVQHDDLHQNLLIGSRVVSWGQTDGWK
jgi:hypothetical protein